MKKYAVKWSNKKERDNTQNRKGKVLRVKHGYNPNSSSLGSIVFALPVALLAVPAIFSAAAAVIFSKYINNKPVKKSSKDKVSNEVA